MKRFWWKQFFAPDDGGTSGGDGKSPDGGTQDGGKKPEEGKKDEDVTGLKSALEKERQARKELQQQLGELRAMSGKGEEATKELEKLQKKLAEFEFREQREVALAKAVEAITKDGKFVVDQGKALKLAGKLGNVATLEADVAEIVDLLKTEKGEAPAAAVKQAAIKGQPAKEEGATGELPYSAWAELARTDPEAYKRMIEERRKGRLA